MPLTGTGSRQMNLVDLEWAIAEVLFDLSELKNADTFSLRLLEFANVRQGDIESVDAHLRRQL